MTISNRTLFFGDNLKILEERIPEETFDLIYLDPPFNSNRDYNVLFQEGRVDSSAQIHAFEDTWEWTDDTVRLFNELKKHPNPKIAILIHSLAEFIGYNEMMAYLVNMTARLMPLHRVPKPTGSLYLHCDPTSSHYLKVILDVIFGVKNFQNEIVWCYEIGARGKKRWARKHDTILFYSKSEHFYFDWKSVATPRKEGTHMRTKTDENGRAYQEKTDKKSGKIYKYYVDEGTIPPDWWVGIQQLNREAAERLGYPTQKPEELLERIIKASTKENDYILDPFCGCGTTVAVAERLKRRWVGIDISMLAINVMHKRLKDHYRGIRVNIDGLPMDYEGAYRLAQDDKYAFQDWAISLVGANPPSGQSKKGADKGIDGLILFYDRVDFRKPQLRKIIVQVKGGATNRGDIAKLKGDMDREGAPMGVLITINDPTSEMKKEAAIAGDYQYSASTTYPRIQLLPIKDWFNGRKLNLPSEIVNPFRKAAAVADQDSLLQLIEERR